MGRREDFILTIYTKILPLAITLVSAMVLLSILFQSIFSKIEMAGMREAFGLMASLIMLTLVAFVLFAGYQIALSKDIKDLLEERLPLRADPDEKEKEERIETSGGGALVGMIVGGLLGLSFGPAGVIVGGILGALVGNQIEYESIRMERKKRKKA
jgi:hypothetical protein